MILDGAVRKYKDGREVCEPNAKGRTEYRNRIECMVRRQQGLCGLCPEPLSFDEATFEHSDLRGMGGGRRDDRIVNEEGNMLNLAAHADCNTHKGSRRS